MEQAKEDKSIFADLGEAAVIGAVVGGFLGVGVGILCFLIFKENK